jgi:hypothetical protein
MQQLVPMPGDEDGSSDGAEQAVNDGYGWVLTLDLPRNDG